MRLPTWEECDLKSFKGDLLTPVEYFIYHHGPGHDWMEWGLHLAAALQWYAAQQKPVDPELPENWSQRR